jgi:hypothetical protein
MEEIKIKGNCKSFQIHNKIEYIEVKLSGIFSSLKDFSALLDYGNYHLQFSNKQNFYTFADKVKGASLERLILLSQELQLDPNFIYNLNTKGEIGISLFKSILLIYNWIEVALTDPSEINIENIIYNQFITDYTGKMESQKDIYFISSKYLSSVYGSSIQRLIDLNLLVSATFCTKKDNYQTYFIPLIKPGVSRTFFKTDFDKSGNKTYDLWKNILNERDSRIKYWLNYKI